MTTHPKYAQEREFLATTVAAIQEALARRVEASFEGGANNYTNRVLNCGLREDILARLREHGQAPYFVRMDFKDRQAEQYVYGPSSPTRGTCGQLHEAEARDRGITKMSVKLH